MVRTANPDDPGVAIAASVRTLGDAFAVFRRFASPKVLATGLLLAITVRGVAAVSGAAGFGWWDLVGVGTVVGLVPFVEWFVHRFVLHVEPFSVGRLLIDPGIGHREHHDNPRSVNWVVLRGVDAALFQVVNALVAATVVGVPLALAGRPVLGPSLTAIVAAVIALSHYEWSHFLFHTAYRPKTARYRRLKANHTRHHFRDERAWLGITSNLGDRALRTLPTRHR
ncbi:MAG: sterol desaturase family protein [Actinomycetota bacterium]